VNPIASIEARLLDPSLGEPVFRQVGGAADLAELQKKRPAAVPAIFIFPGEELSEENERATGPILQNTSYQFKLVIVTRNLADRRGGKAAGDVWELKEDAKRRLVGWTPEGMEEPLENGGGRVTGFVDGDVYWEHDFYSGRLEEESSDD